MKLAFFDEFRLGVVVQNQIFDITEELRDVPRRGPEDLMPLLIERFADYHGRIEAVVARTPGVDLSQVRLRAPLPKPANIVCMAVNYDDGLVPSSHTNAFHKTPSAIIGPGDTMVLPDVPAIVFEGEAEIAVVIGKRASHVPVDKAMDYVFGYMNFIDGSARGLPPATDKFFVVKSRETFAPIGPYIVTRDEIADPQNLRIRLSVNGELKQDFNTKKMITDIKNSIAWLSAMQTLMPGDIIATGTDHCGLNAFQDGDVVELEGEGLGVLSVKIKDELKRTWSRETRIERHNKGHSNTAAPQLSGKYAEIAKAT
jgi:2-keto-4-pentenoate hydratase/2-oxohepta-3-ene-1,7-dioic acid hydratase in catechol pathway